MAIALHGKYRHRLTGLTCTVIEYHGDRQRVTIRLEDGRELQEIAFHDLFDLPPKVMIPKPIPTPEPPVLPEYVVNEDTTTQALAEIKEREQKRRAATRPRFSNENDVADPAEE